MTSAMALDTASAPYSDPAMLSSDKTTRTTPEIYHHHALEDPVDRFTLLTLDEGDDDEESLTGHQGTETDDNPLLQMPQPRPFPFTQHASAPTVMLHARTITPPRLSQSPASFLQSTPAIVRTPPRSQPTTGMPNLNAPPMIRAHSSPICYSPTFSSFSTPSVQRSSSPLRSPKRVRSPFRYSNDETYLTASGSTLSPEISSISEDAELEITPRSHHSIGVVTPSLPLSSNSPYGSLTFPRPLRRRPASPLRALNNSGPSSVPASPHLSATTMASSSNLASSSSSANSAKFNETFPSDLPYYYANSSRSFSLSTSMPSTPTSVRSRSPSISSLETIPDSPDAEVQALEQDERDREERKRVWDFGGSQSNSSERGTGTRSGFGGRDKRKRWSVCGAEKRSDLNLETIWED